MEIGLGEGNAGCDEGCSTRSQPERTVQQPHVVAREGNGVRNLKLHLRGFLAQTKLEFEWKRLGFSWIRR